MRSLDWFGPQVYCFLGPILLYFCIEGKGLGLEGIFSMGLPV